MPTYDVVILGSGLGGLLSGYILSKEGYNVCIIEKNHQLGGCLQTFRRKGCTFNTGLNYTESLDDGQILNRYFRYFGLMDKLKLKRLDQNGFETIAFDDAEYKFAMGHDNFIQTLSQSFKGHEKEITEYKNKLRDVCNSFPLYTLTEGKPYIIDNQYLSIGATDYIKSILSNERLQNVVAGINMLYAGVSDKTPLFIHALISNSFIESSWRLVDGSGQMHKILADSIKGFGGTILRNTEAVKLVVENEQITQVETNNSDPIKAKYIISNIHPEKTIELLDSGKIKKAYFTRIKSLENTMGMFTLYAVLKKDKFRYMNHNYYYYATNNVWTANTYNATKGPENYLLMTPATSKSDQWADSLSIITYIHYDELKKWENTFVEHRGEDYLAFKQQKAEQLLNLVEKKFPNIRSQIESYYTSTPLTYRDYTGTKHGSAYGVLKDYNDPIKSMILPKTKIANLFLTGQNINLHGILGVTISSVLTCAELMDINYLIRKINNA